MTDQELYKKIWKTIESCSIDNDNEFVLADDLVEGIVRIINQYVTEVIGADEKGYTNKTGYHQNESAYQEVRNELRAEQRQRAGL